MPDDARWLAGPVLLAAGATAGGWLTGLLAYDRLISFMLDRAWLVQDGALVPAIAAPWLVAVGAGAALVLAVRDVSAGRIPSRRRTIARGLMAIGAPVAAVGLWHAHARGQLTIPGRDFVLAKDLLYHVPGMVVFLTGWYRRPLPPRSPAAQET